MPKHVNVDKLIFAIGRMTFILEVSLLQSLTKAINRYKAQAPRDESVGAELWHLFNEIPEGLRAEFQI